MVDADTDRLLGLPMLSHLGAELLPQGMVMLHTPGRRIGPLTEALVIHPTLSEGAKAAISTLKPATAVPTASGDLAE